MDNQKPSHIAKVPTALIFFTLALLVAIDGFSWFAVTAPLSKQISNNVVIKEIPVTSVPTSTPTATPSATVTSAVKVVPVSKEGEVVAPTTRPTIR